VTMRSLLIGLGLSVLASTAFAQQADTIQPLREDWQAVVLAQGHLIKSMQAVAEELQAARTKIKALETEINDLKNKDKDKKDEPPPAK